MPIPSPWRSAAVAVVIVFAGPAHAQVELRLFYENFTSESEYPVSANVDAIGAGFQIDAVEAPETGSNFPLLTGSVARAVLDDSIAPIVGQGLVWTPTTMGTDSFHLRARYGAFTGPTETGTIWVRKTVRFEGDEDAVHYSLILTLSLLRDASGSQGVFDLVETATDETTGTSLGSRSPPGVTLSSGDAFDLLDSGATFFVELELDREREEATARLSGPLINDYTVGPFALSDFDRQAPDQMTLLVARGDGVLPATVATLDIDDVEVYQSFTSVFDVDAPGLDAVDASPGDGLCETAALDCTLRAAVQESNAIPGRGRITLPAGVHTLAIPGADEDAAVTGDLDLLDDVELVGAGRDVTIVDAAALDRAFHVPSSALDRYVRLRGLTLRNGRADTLANPAGGLVESYGNTELEDCRVEDGIANFGGGIFNGRRMTISDCVIEGNVTGQIPGSGSPGRGGGIASGAVGRAPWPVGPVELEVRDSAIVDNEANAGSGSGAEVFQNDLARFVNTTVSGLLGVQLFSQNSALVLEHATVVASGPHAAVETVLAQAPSSVEFANVAIEGTPACDLSPLPPFQETYRGHNASNDASCGFVGASDVTGVALGLAPLATTSGGSAAHLPTPSSPLIDAADLAECPFADQLGVFRPLDGDADGTADCDLGAIEVPEPGVGLGLLPGGFFAAALRRRTSRAPRRRTR